MSAVANDADRLFLLRLASGWSNKDIAEAMGVPQRTVSSKMSEVRRRYITEIDEVVARATGSTERPKVVPRPYIAKFIVDSILSHDERKEWIAKAKVIYKRHVALNLISGEAQMAIRLLVRPENFGMTYAELAEMLGLTTPELSAILNPILDSLGHSRVRLQIMYYLLWHVAGDER